jgi:hypothetical protein
MDQHALAVDIRDLQRRDLTDAQAGTVGKHEDGAIFGGVGSGEQEGDLGAAENFRGAAWNFCARDTGGGVAAGGGAEQAAHGRQIHVARARRAPLADEVEQKALDIGGRDISGRFVRVGEKASGTAGER